MRILLVGTIPIDIFYPMGLLCLYSYVKARLPEIEIKVIEYWEEKSSDKIFEKFNPDIVGISSMSQSYELATKVAKFIKSSNPSIPIVLGGTHVSLLPEAIRKCFDIGVIGEGEDTFIELIKLFLDKKAYHIEDLKQVEGIIYWDKDEIVHNKLRNPVDLEHYPPMDYSQVNKEMFKVKPIGTWGVWGVEGLMETSRGCPFKCIFCATTRFWKRPRYFPIEWIALNILKLIELGCTHIQMTDDLFASSKKRLREMDVVFRKYGIQDKIELACSSRTSIFDEELCRLIKNVGGTTVFFGFESGNQRVLQMLKGESASLEDNYNAVKVCYKEGLECWGSFMVGAPTETIEEIRDTIRFIEWSKQYKVRRMGVGILAPYPGSPIWDLALKMGKVSIDMDFSKWVLRRDIVVDGAFIEPERREEFADLWDDLQRACHSFKWNKLWTLLKSGPIRTFLYLFQAPWPIIKRMFVPTIP